MRIGISVAITLLLLIAAVPKARAQSQWSIHFDSQTFSTIAPQGFSLTYVPKLARPYESMPWSTIPFDAVQRKPVELVNLQPGAIPRYSISGGNYDVSTAPMHENFDIGNSVFGYVDRPQQPRSLRNDRRTNNSQPAANYSQSAANSGSRRQPLGW